MMSSFVFTPRVFTLTPNIEFIVRNDGGPGAFRADLSGTGELVTASVPESSSIILLALGLIGLVLARSKIKS